MDCSTPGSPILHYLPSLLKFMSIKSVILSKHLILGFPLLLCLPSFPASGYFSVNCIWWPKCWSFSFSISQGWSPLGWTDWISLLSEGLSRVFSSTTVQKHQIFRAQPSLWCNSHTCTQLWAKPEVWLYGSLLAKWCLCFLICCLGLS